MAANGFIGSGDIYLNRIVNGVAQGMKGPFYANKFEIKPNQDRKELLSKGRNDYGTVLETVNLAKATDFTMELSQVVGESMAMAMLATATALDQESGTLTAVAVVAKLDVWVQVMDDDTPIGKLTGTPVLTDTTGDTTYVLGTDYLVNAELGWIKAIDGGDIDADQSLKLTMTYGAITGTHLSGVTNNDIRAEIIFDGINQIDNSPCIVRVREAVIAADSALDFMANEFAKVQLKGSMKKPAGQAEPFTIELRNAT